MNINTEKEKVLSEMKKYFGSDTKRINHAETVLKFTEEILKHENGDCNVVMLSAILHDIGIKECERKYHSTDGQLQEKEGPPIAREILHCLRIKKDVIDEVCKIIASHHSPGEVNSINFKILWDADWLVNLKDEAALKDKEKLRNTIDKVFLTC
ncbi:MAG: HD domain-containing protein, partial [Elusimicrobiota bacterium]|nr:HD domain-containing protein [Elusimicrobiota bacterium]